MKNLSPCASTARICRKCPNCGPRIAFKCRRDRSGRRPCWKTKTHLELSTTRLVHTHRRPDWWLQRRLLRPMKPASPDGPHWRWEMLRQLRQLVKRREMFGFCFPSFLQMRRVKVSLKCLNVSWMCLGNGCFSQESQLGCFLALGIVSIVII